MQSRMEEVGQVKSCEYLEMLNHQAAVLAG